ncbi:F-box only protein 6-like [Melanotaenia boesemani]|uniref:F-box only protein 6-like n=1 Tax=Melanotaenia boesemani TaxID=1250792 RepID=UPI001C03E84E|nr:F-box only protein 6-like [Melanotaenia boesemani]
MDRKARAMVATYSNDSNTSATPPKAAQASTPIVVGLTFPLPLDILEEIFLHLPHHQVVLTCRLVCHQWKQVADSDFFWRERCRREGYHLRDASKTPDDWRLFYFLCKTRRNLIQNPRGENKMKGWKIMENGGDKWAVHLPRVPHPNEAIKTNFVTSYLYAPRTDCGCEYMIFVQLLNQDKKVVAEFTPDTVYFPQWNDERWHQMTHVFKDYGPGVRYIHFVHGGKDTQFWAGWYGIRLTESCVEVCPADD